MAHLIQPIKIGETFYCVNNQGGMRTIGILEDDAVDNEDDTFTLFEVDEETYGDGSVTIGVSCASKVEYRLIGTSEELQTAGFSYEVELNGDNISGGTGITDFNIFGTINLTPSPCGNIIKWRVYFDGTGEGYDPDTFKAVLEIENIE